jgi:hypothetical protein
MMCNHCAICTLAGSEVLEQEQTHQNCGRHIVPYLLCPNMHAPDTWQKYSPGFQTTRYGLRHKEHSMWGNVPPQLSSTTSGGKTSDGNSENTLLNVWRKNNQIQMAETSQNQAQPKIHLKEDLHCRWPRIMTRGGGGSVI